MANYISKENIEEIAEGIIFDYLKNDIINVDRIEIEKLLTDYFKLNIVYARFAESDPNIDAFIADGNTPLWIWENKKRVQKVYPFGTVVFDVFLKNKDREYHRRFSFAHEASHYISHQLYGTLLGANHTGFDSEKTYSFAELRKQFSITEAQMNSMAAALLMPKFLLNKVIKKYSNGKNLNIYGDTVMLSQDRLLLQKMSEHLGVSTSALRIRLVQCGFVNQRPLNDFIDKIKVKGGWGVD